MTARPPPLPMPVQFNQAWAGALVRSLEAWFKTLVFGDYVIQGNLTTQRGRVKKQRLITTSTGSISLTDEVIDVNYAGAVTLTFTAPLDTAQVWYVQDSSGAAASNPITVEGGSKNINGGASVSLATNYGRLMIEYNGTQYVSSG